ncbi:phosphate ABC transporter substrate-binding/OmpA family protein [Motilimonas eburnea]|uniref:phosphate ABC transporter substrate-binding/OmpA family protein n=1 Tax=Motilimonas eburnea TaxID=1737488 RepID=UPI001E406F37|nr:phosphate ABC transporter substrate-binding/OmpA family protein [Motilimonas eburnea]MCE2571364.1 OmpA family protein [Motilimonas eburnea]
MQGHTKIALGLLVLGVSAVAGYKLLQPMLTEQRSIAQSDARSTKGKITIGVDNWVGYYPLCSKEMKRSLRQQGYLLECVDDQANYQQRLKAMSHGELDLAVASVDAWLTSGKAFNYPGAIVAVIDESKGGDAIIANIDSVNSLDDLKTPKQLTIGFTPASPSEHLLRAVASHFDIKTIKEKQFNLIETQGSHDALTQLQSGQLDVAVLWEPDVSLALESKQFKRILGTENTQSLIVDVLLANHDFARDQSDTLELVLTSYFKVLKFYRDHPQELIKELSDTTELNQAQVQQLLNGVQWASLNHNTQKWFKQHGALVQTIESSLNIFADFADIPSDLIPNGDPYRLINSAPITAVQQRLQTSAIDQPSEPPTIHVFDELTEQQWANMVEVGTLKTRAIVFSSGSNELTEPGAQQLAQIAENLNHYPNFRIRIQGHTNNKGDASENLKLSKARAEAIKEWLIAQGGFDRYRIQAQGLGGTEPLPRQANESRRSYQSRLKRVEVRLLTAAY